MNLYQWLCVLGVPSVIGLLIGIFVKKPIERRIEAQEAQQATQQAQSQAIMLGVQALLRDRLLQGYRHYIAQGWAAYDDRSNLENIYVQYEALGPNSVMDQLHAQFVNLPEQPTTEGGHHE